MRKELTRGKGVKVSCQNQDKGKTPKNKHFSRSPKRRRPDLNRCIRVLQTHALPLGYCAIFNYSKTPRVGLEPTTTRLTAECSTIELSRIIKGIYLQNHIQWKKILTFSLLYSPSNSFQTFWISPRPISDSQLHTLLHFHLCPIYLVVFKGSYFFRMGYLILRGASRLDAFSVYPFPTWLLGHALGRTTDTPEVSPSRSSRTKDSSSQISYAHAG